MKKTAHYILQFTWALPQNLLGLIVFVISLLSGRKLAFRYNVSPVILTRRIYGLCLGIFIFVQDSDNPTLVRHEYGHTLQSLILGPLWLLVIGLPSIIWAGLFSGYRKSRQISYYSFYTESWANRLGGITERSAQLQ